MLISRPNSSEMYFLNLFVIAVFLTILMRNQCAAQWQNSRECRDAGHKVHCEQIKLRQKCNRHHFREICKKTCGACGSFAPRRIDFFCRDTGTAEFCKMVKPFCSSRGRRSQGLHIPSYTKYCRKTCELCYPRPPATQKDESYCVDRHICQRLTSLYNITNCTTITSPKLRKRAFKKCPVLCGLCTPERKAAPEVARLVRPAIVDPLDTQHTIRISKNINRPPHPPIENRDRDDEPRSGTFYIYTQYLSL